MFKTMKETKPNIRTEELKIRNIKERKFLTENTTDNIDIFNLIICMTRIASELDEVNTSEKETRIIIEQMMKITEAVAVMADILEVDSDIFKVERKKTIKEELEKVEYMPYDIIPALRFYEIIERINTIIDGYDNMIENISYEKNNEIATDVTRIENSLTNIETTISAEIKNNLIYKSK